MTTTAIATSPAQEEDKANQLRNLTIEILCEEVGYKEPFATPIAEAIVRGLRLRMGGREWYIPAPSAAERHAEIRKKYNELVGKVGVHRARDLTIQLFSISLSTFYNALNAK